MSFLIDPAQHQRLRRNAQRFDCSIRELISALIDGIPIPAPPRRPASVAALEDVRALGAARIAVTQATAALTRHPHQSPCGTETTAQHLALQQTLAALDQLIRERLCPARTADG